MTTVVGALVGAVVAVVGVVGGVAAYQGGTDAVPQTKLYVYADN